MKIFTAKLIILMTLLCVLFISNSCNQKPDNTPLTEQSLQNLIAFTKLYGYVRYFHPSTEAQKIDWDKFAIYGANKIENVENTKTLVNTLNELFLPIAPTLKIFESDKPPVLNADDLIPKDTSNLRSIFWQHFMGEATVQEEKLVYSKRDAYHNDDSIFGILKNYPKPNEYFTTKINNNVSIALPLALYSSDSTTTPESDRISLNKLIEESNKTIDSTLSVENRASRFGIIIIAWNVFQHFYPYFVDFNTDWQSVLPALLTESAVNKDRYEFTITLKRLIANLNDGHAHIDRGGYDDAIYSPPFMWDWLENKIVITRVFDETDKALEKGDIILEINGVSSIEVIKNEELLISASTLGRKRITNGIAAGLSSVINALAGKINSKVNLKIQSPNGDIFDIEIKRSILVNLNIPSSLPGIFEIKPGIHYVCLYKATMQDIDSAMNALKNAKGIIFDLRGYPKGNHEVLGHLIDIPVISERWNKPLTVFPDRIATIYDTSGRWIIKPVKPRLTSNIVFITDARAISYAESFMSIVEAFKIADIIGEPTAGTNGNICFLPLPLYFQLIWTQMKVLKQDGSQHNGIGVLPTIPCSPTIKGVLEGRDEQLEKAIEVIEKKMK